MALFPLLLGASSPQAQPPPQSAMLEGESDPKALNSCLSECEDADPGNRWASMLQEKTFVVVTCIFDQGMIRSIALVQCDYKGSWENREVSWKAVEILGAVDRRSDMCLDDKSRDRYACPEKADIAPRRPRGRDGSSAVDRAPLLREARVLDSCHDKFLLPRVPACSAQPPEPPRSCPCPVIERALSFFDERRAAERRYWLGLQQACSAGGKPPRACKGYSAEAARCALESLDYADKVKRHCRRCPRSCRLPR